MSTILIIIAFFIGAVLTGLGMRFVTNAKYKNIIQEAKSEAEVIKKNKMLEVKEKFLSLKSDLEKQVTQRNAKIQATEARLKQRELQINQRLEDLQRKKNETTIAKDNLDAQLELIEKKKIEMDKIHKQEVERLEAISGLSADQAKERLTESLKDEAKTQAASFINEIMDDAKMTANKEAKRIVVQTIQRVATETAIENAVTVFHID